jgi:peptidoglycan/LPS O-acetylase OafA/YrhL
MGSFRLALALAVLLSHADLRIWGLNPGVTAVIGFYLISGYVMAGLIDRHYSASHRVPHFYLDRVLRIFPQYLVIVGVTGAWQLATGRNTPFLLQAPDLMDWMNNILVLPLNYYMFNGSDTYTLIPPAWSLGAELQFYLLAPLMLIWPRFGCALGLLSLGVHAMAWFGYRLLPGVLWVFGLGMLLFRLHGSQRLGKARWANWLAWSAPAAALLIYGLLYRNGLHSAPYHAEVLLGWGLGLPLLNWLAQRPRQAWDERLGDWSYGVFLNHFLLIWLLFDRSPVGFLDRLGLVAASLTLSAVMQRWVEQPVLRWRRHFRRVSNPIHPP